jgi:glycosyltransferase involved in cell wall biosynthesis
MAARLPVVATAVGGTPFLMEDGVTGFLVPAGEPEPMAGRIRELLRDEPLRKRLGGAGRARVETVHSMDGMVRAYGNLYESLMAERRRGGGGGR